MRHISALFSTEATEENIPQILEYVDNNILDGKSSHPLALSYRSLIEEISIKLIECAGRDAELTIERKKTLTKEIIEIQCPGSAVSLYSDDKTDFGGMIVSDFSDKIGQSYRSGVNRVAITIARNAQLTAALSIIVLLAGSLLGLLIHYTVPPEACETVDSHVVNPIITAYITFLKALAPTTAFFSLMSAIPMMLHRIGVDKRLKRLVAGFQTCALCGLLLSLTVCLLMGNVFSGIDVDRALYLNERGNIMGDSISEYIINAMPKDVLSPFSLSNPLPMLLLAVVLGFACASIYNKRGESIRSAVESISVLFNTAFGLLYSTCFTPFVFIAAVEGFAIGGPYFAVCIGVMFLCIVGGILIMFVIYALYMLVNGVNPIKFVKINKSILIKNFIIGSNIDAIPYNKRHIRRRLNISPSLISDGLYLGGLIDMTGNCVAITAAITLLICVLQPTSTPMQFPELILIIFLLSCGAPNQPGSLLIVLTILMEHVGISMTIGCIILIMEALTSRIYAFTNTLGDIVGMTVCFSRFTGHRDNDD